ncbi:MAG: ornithine cyclodeaminase [Acidimicrobiia bacterium]
MATEVVHVDGHIVDSLILAKVLDLVLEAGADYHIDDFRLGRTNLDPSHAVIEITADDQATLDALIEQLQVHGANRADTGDAALAVADLDGVLPAGFYSTTNLATDVRIEGGWHPVANPEMDCGLVVTADGVRTVPMHRARAGDHIVVGSHGVRVHAPDKPRGGRSFEFMNSDISSEKPKALLLGEVATRLRATKERGGKLLVVCGPAVVHTGAAPEVARLVRAGWVDVLFAGNGFAAHDIEAAVLGTSLGVSVREGTPVEHGHSNHLRAINEVRRHGSIAAAVEAGYVSTGVMHDCVRHDVPYVLGGSVRDDGPLPDTIADVVAAADAMRRLLPGVEAALLLASTLHAVATGNLLPADVETFCVEINQAVVTKISDRGSHQALGIVTDVGPFLRQLADELC